MGLALFDLDNTLLAGDSDHAWGQHLVDNGWVDATDYQRSNDYFYAQYQAGGLDIHEYVRFVTQAINRIPAPERLGVRDQFIEQVARQLIAPGTPALLDKHRNQGHTLVIITATIDFITRPIADLLGIEHLIATIAERADTSPAPAFTGRIDGTPSFKQGKVERLSAWCRNLGIDPSQERWFYSDSHNDLPLLELVDHPVAVDADERLQRIAEKNQWPVISLRP